MLCHFPTHGRSWCILYFLFFSFCVPPFVAIGSGVKRSICVRGLRCVSSPRSTSSVFREEGLNTVCHGRFCRRLRFFTLDMVWQRLSY